MRKLTLMKVEEYRKRYKDSTTAILKSDGYIQGDGIQGVEIDFDDKFLPDLGERLFVMIESLPALGPRGFSTAEGDAYEAYMLKRKDELEGAKPPVPTRKFR